MRFRNYGGNHQFVVATEEDLAHVDDLDPARWAATSAPLRDLHCDERFLAALDPAGSGRVRVSQLVAARDWTFARLAKRDLLRERVEVIPITAIDGSGEPGPKLRAAAQRVNSEQKAADPNRIALADVRAFQAGYAKMLANGDGVVPPDVVPEGEVADFLRDVMAVVGSAPDRGGSPGVSAAQLEAYTKGGKAYLSWQARREAASVWGEATASSAALVDELAPVLEAFFLRCELLRQQSTTREKLLLDPESLRALVQRGAPEVEKYLREAPVAAADPAGVLDLAGPLNALFEAPLLRLRDEVLPRALGAGTTTLTRASWARVRDTFAPYAAWQKDKPAEPWDKVPEERLRAQLEGPLPARAADYLARDLAAAPEIAQVEDLEKLLLHVRWLIDLANNMVNFSAIYRPDAEALCESGSLVIDGRRLDFCLRVHDRAAHKPVASESLCFLVYAKVTERDGAAGGFEVVAPVTGGERGRLRVGKRGIFIDVRGKEFDAQVVDVVENPVSVREAALAPFRRAGKFVSDKIEEWVGSQAEARQQALQQATSEGVTRARTAADGAVAHADAAVAGTSVPGATAGSGGAAAATPGGGPASAPAAGSSGESKPAREGLNINSLIVGGGVALAGVGAVLASLFGALTTLRGWIAVLGMIAAVMAISALAGWLKLRRRDLSAILEASGWAVNARMKITARVAAVFAFTPDLPRGARIDRTDALPAVPGEGRGRRLVVLLATLAASCGLAWWAWRHGWMKL